MSRKLAEQIHNYILKERSKISGANKHNFLFVTYKSGPFCGKPLSLSGIYKIVNRVRSSNEELSDLTPHIFRHTWNDKYTDKVQTLIQSGKITEDQAERDRAYLMGWIPNSESARRYSRRAENKRAVEVGLSIQEKFEDENE